MPSKIKANMQRTHELHTRHTTQFADLHKYGYITMAIARDHDRRVLRNIYQCTQGTPIGFSGSGTSGSSMITTKL
jgi:hypothetical protein